MYPAQEWERHGNEMDIKWLKWHYRVNPTKLWGKPPYYTSKEPWRRTGEPQRLHQDVSVTRLPVGLDTTHHVSRTYVYEFLSIPDPGVKKDTWSRIRDPEKPIPDSGSGVKNAPDPGSGSATWGLQRIRIRNIGVFMLHPWKYCFSKMSECYPFPAKY
jgi:hypothetical protein